MKRKKSLAAILAFFFGAFGTHQFYLGNKIKGFLYLFFAIGGIMTIEETGFFFIVTLLAFIDFILILVKPQKEFDFRYNEIPQQRMEAQRQREQSRNRRLEERQSRRDQLRERQGRRVQPQNTPSKRKAANRMNPHKKSGIEKFKDYDFKGAIIDFKKSLEIGYEDPATHFNLACSYSMTENIEKAFFHLDQAVAFGFKDFERIKTHDSLAFLRVQEDFDAFEQNGYRIPEEPKQLAEGENMLDEILGHEKVKETPEPQLELPDTSNLLEQLEKLAKLREQGVLTEEEFTAQKRKLLGN